MSAELKDAVRTFLAARYFCVISTVADDAQPEAAFVAYTSNNDFEIIIGTSNKSRKYQNILQNKSVALVIADTEGEVQYEGEAEVISVEDYAGLAADGHFKLLSGYEKYRNDPTQVYLKITPSWIRFITHGEVDQVTELVEFA